jgi:hypothetical protein
MISATAKQLVNEGMRGYLGIDGRGEGIRMDQMDIGEILGQD